MKRSLIYFSCLMILFFLGDCKPSSGPSTGEIVLLPEAYHDLNLYTESGLLADQVVMKARWDCMDGLEPSMDNIKKCREEALTLAMTSIEYHSHWNNHKNIQKLINSLPRVMPTPPSGGLSGCTKSAVGSPDVAPSGGPIMDPGHDCDMTCFTHSTLQLNRVGTGDEYALDILLSPVPAEVTITASLYPEDIPNTAITSCDNTTCLQSVVIGGRDFLRLTLVGDIQNGDYRLSVTHSYSTSSTNTDFRVTLAR